jgi:hypothetical protein
MMVDLVHFRFLPLRIKEGGYSNRTVNVALDVDVLECSAVMTAPVYYALRVAFQHIAQKNVTRKQAIEMNAGIKILSRL